MWTSVPHTPARRTRIKTSFSRIFGSGTFFNAKPGPADSFTSAFTSDRSSHLSNHVRHGLARAICRARTETSHFLECDGSLTALLQRRAAANILRVIARTPSH